MTCGILLVTHPGVGTALLDVATRLLRQLPLKTEAFEVPFDADLDALLPLASAALRRVDGGEGVAALAHLACIAIGMIWFKSLSKDYNLVFWFESVALIAFGFSRLRARLLGRPWLRIIERGLVPIAVGLIASSGLILAQGSAESWTTVALTVCSAISRSAVTPGLFLLSILGA